MRNKGFPSCVQLFIININKMSFEGRKVGFYDPSADMQTRARLCWSEHAHPTGECKTPKIGSQKLAKMLIFLPHILCFSSHMDLLSFQCYVYTFMIMLIKHFKTSFALDHPITRN